MQGYIKSAPNPLFRRILCKPTVSGRMVAHSETILRSGLLLPLSVRRPLGRIVGSPDTDAKGCGFGMLEVPCAAHDRISNLRLGLPNPLRQVRPCFRDKTHS